MAKTGQFYLTINNIVNKAGMLWENDKRVRYLDKDDIYRLLEVCREHSRSIITTLNTEMNKGEILELRAEGD